MFCHQCGSKVQDTDRFCGSCGAAIETTVQPYQVKSNLQWKVPQFLNSRRGKLTLSVIVSVIGILAIGYGIARGTYGPSSPEKLEKQALAAIEKKDVEALARYLAPGQKELTKPEVLNTFKTGFNEETAKIYKLYFNAARLRAEKADNEKGKKNFEQLFDTESGPVTFTKTKSWRGTRWGYIVNPVDISFKKDESWKVETTIGSLKNDAGTFSNLWPAEYTYESQISNVYGGSETVKGTVNLLDGSDVVYLTQMVYSKLTVIVPKIKGIAFSINGSPLQVKNSDGLYQQTVTISPALKEGKIQAKGNVLGKQVEETVNIDSTSTRIDLNGVVNQAVAKQALDVIYDGAISWSEAYNAGDAAKLKAVDPKGRYYQEVTRSLNPAKLPDNKVTFEKVALSPESIRISDDEFRIEATEKYTYEKEYGLFNPSKTRIVQSEYVLQKQPDKDEWWIVQQYNDYWGNNHLESSKAIKKEKPSTAVAAQ